MHGSSGYLNGEGESHTTEAGEVVDTQPPPPSKIALLKKKRFVPTAEQNKKRWHEISGYFDNACFYIFGSAAFLVPLIVAATLDRKSLGV